MELRCPPSGDDIYCWERKTFMTKGMMALLVSGMVLSFTALPAMAQNDNGNRGKHKGWYKNDNRARGNDFDRGRNQADRRDLDRYLSGNPYQGVSTAAVSAFDTRAGQVRADIASRLAAGAITPAQASRLHARLDSVMSLRTEYLNSGGVLTASELAQLNTRLNEVRIALRSRVFF
jgi:hypothetical protein